jgi:asparagine N-glycosylation enzyme membrane subunit Stt3
VCCAAYALARRFTSPPAAALAGLLYAFAPFRYALAHVHMLGTFWLPLALLGTERWLGDAKPRRRYAVLVAVAVAMQGLSSVYLAYAMLVAYAVYLPLALLRWRHNLDRRRLTILGVALLCSAVAIGLPVAQYVGANSGR